MWSTTSASEVCCPRSKHAVTTCIVYKHHECVQNATVALENEGVFKWKFTAQTMRLRSWLVHGMVRAHNNTK
jgi:hypothetical protein